MKNILVICLLFGLVAAAVGYYMYNKPVESLKNAKPAFKVSADALFAAYEQDEAAANARYLDQVLEVQGKITSVNTDTSGLSLTLQTGSPMFGVICKLEDKSAEESNFTIGQSVRMKGQCTGFLMDVVLIRCTVVE